MAADARVELKLCVPAAWLDDKEFIPVAENLARLEADAELVRMLQLGQFSDHVWNPVAEELARYGLAVLQSWIRSHTIFAKVKTKTGWGLPILDGWPDAETAEQLATDTVVNALNYFRDKVLAAGKWDPTRGASLRTYFIGQCLFQFPNLYRTAYNIEIERQEHELLTDDDTLFRGQERSVEDVLGGSRFGSAGEEALAQVTTVMAKIAFGLIVEGYSAAEIAVRLNKTEKQIENMLVYQRSRIRKAS
ncbi:sigma-70 family RNA polymerase sigma factor [Nocardia salmonicida]|uniref:sigma-70 family RNA polymerase sigma factor n=1 Tax=Nocardia salmonicida TaxID=53431 RepID=UPI003799CBE1